MKKNLIITGIISTFCFLFMFNSLLLSQDKINKNKPRVPWTGKTPALILKENKSKVYTGKIIKIEETGVVFDPKRESLFYNPPSKFYSYSEIETLVNAKGQIYLS